MASNQPEQVDLKEHLQHMYDTAVRNGNTELAKAVLGRAYGRVVIDTNHVPQKDVWDFVERS